MGRYIGGISAIVVLLVGAVHQYADQGTDIRWAILLDMVLIATATWIFWPKLGGKQTEVWWFVSRVSLHLPPHLELDGAPNSDGREAPGTEVQGGVHESEQVEAPSPIEQQAIDDLRALYHSEGRDAWWSAFKMLRQIRQSLKKEPTLARLLERIERESKSAAERAEDVLEDPPQTPLSRATGAFGEFFQQYMRTVRWVHHAAGDLRFSRASFKPYWKWEDRHERFLESSRSVLNRASLKGLKSHVQAVGGQRRYADDRFAGFNDLPDGSD